MGKDQTVFMMGEEVGEYQGYAALLPLNSLGNPIPRCDCRMELLCLP